MIGLLGLGLPIYKYQKVLARSFHAGKYVLKLVDICKYLRLDDRLDCGNIDNVDPHFYSCKFMKTFWNTISNWWYDICNNCNLNNEPSVILGIIEKCCHQRQLNYIIMAAKWPGMCIEPSI